MSMSFSSSQSTSEPTVTETPENSLIDAISQYAQGLGQQMDQWASQEFTKTSGITDQAIGNFFNVSQRMAGLSNNLTSDYNNITRSDYQQLHDEANSFASPNRMAVDMGQAGATAAQAGDAARHNAEEGLKSYGVNVNDGRYAALDKAAAVQQSANVAGAMNQQRNADIATGQQLRKQSLDFGATLPSSIANVNNTGIQANAGASNASLANANTGANLKSLADKYLSTAMGIKLPPTGQKSQSTSNGTSSHPDSGGSRSGGGSGGNGAGGGSGVGYPGGPAWMPQHGGADGNGGGVGFRSTGFGGAGAEGGDEEEGGNAAFNDYGSGTDQGAGAFGSSYGEDFGNGNTYDNDGTQGFGGSDFNQDYSGGATDDTGLGAYNYDQGANQASGWGDNPYGAGGGDSFSGDNSGYDPSETDWGSGAEDFARGGAIPDGGIMQSKIAPRAMPPAPGSEGPVPASMSPSGGRQVDDVQAQGPGGSQLNLNAGEFMIPRDVALWKGQEFFQNLIAQSRQKRVTAPAHGKPARPGNSPARPTR